MPAAKKQLRKSPTTASQTEKINPDQDEDGVDEEEQEATSTAPEEDEAADDAGPGPEDPALAVALNQNDDADLAPAYERMTGAPRDGKSFQAGEPVILKGIQKGGLLVVQEPVYRAVRSTTSSRWRFHLLVARGAEISMGKVKELGKREDEKDAGNFQADQKHFLG